MLKFHFAAYSDKDPALSVEFFFPVTSFSIRWQHCQGPLFIVEKKPMRRNNKLLCQLSDFVAISNFSDPF